jgi:hypothetical protein
VCCAAQIGGSVGRHLLSHLRDHNPAEAAGGVNIKLRELLINGNF